MDAGPEGGRLTTRPVRFSGEHLWVNVDCPEGELTAEVLDEEGRPIEPFTADRCTPISTDGTIEPVTWRDASVVEAHRARSAVGRGGRVAGGPGKHARRDLLPVPGERVRHRRRRRGGPLRSCRSPASASTARRSSSPVLGAILPRPSLLRACHPMGQRACALSLFALREQAFFAYRRATLATAADAPRLTTRRAWRRPVRRRRPTGRGSPAARRGPAPIRFRNRDS